MNPSVGHRKVQLDEAARAVRLVDELVDVQLHRLLRHSLRDDDEPAVLLAEVQRPVRLPRKHDRSSARGV